MTAKRIMLVEDEAVIAMDISQRLESYGYQVVATPVSGKQALERLPEVKPDLIVMDIKIKGPEDGIDTAIKIEQIHRVPVIFLSANSDPETVARARAAGAYAYLIKPFRPEELHASIELTLVKASMENQVRLSEQWLDKTLHCISDGVIATDENGNVRLVNPVAERLLGCGQQDASGRPLIEVLRQAGEGVGRSIVSAVADALDRKCVVQMPETLSLVGQGLLAVEVEVKASPILGDDRELLGAVLVLRDVTQRRAVERAQREKEQAERDSVAKSEFLSRVSHELRTPLNAILGFGQLLAEPYGEETLSPQQADNIHEIMVAGRHLLDMVNEILDLARIERGHLELNVEPLPLAPVIGSCLEQVRPLADARRISASAALAPHFVVRSDPVRTRQVFLNLLSNAIKYNREGGEIRVTARPAGDMVRIEVADTGIGIAAENLHRLFKPFERIESSATSVEGTGIGLALVSRLVEALGGRIGVFSAEGAGSTFWVELPLEKGEAGSPA